MGRNEFYFGLVPGVVLCIFFPLLVSGATVTCTNSYAGTQTRTYELPEKTLNPGANQLNRLGTDAASAQADIGKTFYTSELSVFHDAECAAGPCEKDTPGIAHRTWPLGACVAVCNLQSKDCAITVVMDRGPNTKLGCRTIDANPALRVKLAIGGLVPATYQLLKLSGPCDTGGPVNIPRPDPAASHIASGPGVGGMPGASQYQPTTYKPQAFAQQQPAAQQPIISNTSPGSVQTSPYFSPTSPVFSPTAYKPVYFSENTRSTPSETLLSLLNPNEPISPVTAPTTGTVGLRDAEKFALIVSTGTPTTSDTYDFAEKKTSDTFISEDLAMRKSETSKSNTMQTFLTTLQASLARLLETLRTLI